MTDEDIIEEVKKKFDSKFRGPSVLWVEKEEVKRFLGWSIRKVLEKNRNTDKKVAKLSHQ